MNGSLVINTTSFGPPLITSTTSPSTGVAGSIAVANFNLIEGTWFQNNGSLPTFYAKNFLIASGTLNPANVSFLRVTGGTGASVGTAYQIVDVYGLQGINSSSALRSSFWQLNNNIDASGTVNWGSSSSTNRGFVPIGYSTNTSTPAGTEFTGFFTGQGFVINDLYESSVDTSTSGYVSYNAGLFGAISSGATIANVGLNNANITGTFDVGGLVGNVIGASGSVSITNDYVSGAITTTLPSAAYSGIGGFLGVVIPSAPSLVFQIHTPLHRSMISAQPMPPWWIHWLYRSASGSVSITNAVQISLRCHER